MLKIVEVRTSDSAQNEYVALQNLGLVTLSLRGWAICTEAYLDSNLQRAWADMYIFREDIPIKPYTRVVLFTGGGEDGWVPTVDGKQAYCACWGRMQSVWSRAKSVHVLQMAASRRIVPVEQGTTQQTAQEADNEQPVYAVVNPRQYTAAT